MSRWRRCEISPSVRDGKAYPLVNFMPGLGGERGYLAGDDRELWWCKSSDT